METKKETIDRFLAKVLKTDEPFSAEQNLLKDLGLTSLHMMELIALVEDEFDIIVPVNKILGIKTVGELYFAIEHIDEFLR